MNSIKITPNLLCGKISAIASKSDVHRLMICAAFSEHKTTIHNITLSKDILATANCLESLGAKISFEKSDCIVLPIKKASEKVFLDCFESGSTLRFLLPVACAMSENVSVTGQGRLPSRPIAELIEVLKQGNVVFDREALPLITKGRFCAGNYTISGNVSSQYISGLLFALSLIPKNSTLTLSSELESASYVDMTISALKKFGVNIEFKDNTYYIYGKEKLTSPKEITADGDWSNSAFFLISGAIGKEITVCGLDTESLQGDKEILNILERFGAKVSVSGTDITVSPLSLTSCTVDLKNIPDMLPALSVVACFAKGETHFTGGARLRLKESDRISSVAKMINDLGGCAKELKDGLIVSGKALAGGTVDSANDHRIAMAASVAASLCKDEVTILDPLAVNKSYPNFYKDFESLGGKVYV